MVEIQNLTTLLRTRAEHEGDATLFTFLAFPNDGEDAVASAQSYAQLDARARSIAAALQQRCKRGDRAVLLYPPSLEYIAAFFGCLYAGVIAVPAYPPDPTRLARTLPRLRAIMGDSGASVVLTTREINALSPMVFKMLPDLQAATWLATDDLSDPSGWQALDIGADDVAFLQYTSGSTGDPKGVVLTHANLLANERMITEAFRTSRSSVGVGWLPLYHDMGLIGNVIQPISMGFPIVLMSPLDFLRRPVRWLDAISQYRGTVSGGPNFAYDLCIRRVSEQRRTQIDLSSWAVAFNGAEPVRADTLRRFAEAFAPAGFSAKAFLPCYGLAEATLIVTGAAAGTGARTAEFVASSIDQSRPLVASSNSTSTERRELVGCGRAIGDGRIAIVDPSTRRPSDDGHIGEIWVWGDHVARGYWQRQHDAFTGSTEPGDGSTYLRTGDLGFLQDGELFVTGRLKDLLIVRGRNIYPQDVERTVEDADPSIRPGCVACFAVDAGGEERLVVVAEVDHHRLITAKSSAGASETLVAIRRDISLAHELVPHAIVLIKARSIGKTSSGKIQRFAAKQAFLAGELEVLVSDVAGSVDIGGTSGPSQTPAIRQLSLASTSAEDVQAWLRAMAARALGVAVARIDPDAPFASFGLDSMGAVELAHVVEAQLDIVVPLSMFLGERSLRAISVQLAELAEARALERSVMPAESAAHAAADDVPEALSGNQESLWYLQELEPDNAAYNLHIVARMRGPLDVGHLETAALAVVQRHPVLRTTYLRTPDGPRQVIHPELPPSFTVHETSESVDAILAQAASLSVQPFDLKHGPMLRVTLWRLSTDDAVLMIATHHVAIDLWSVVLMLGELRSTYDKLARGVAPSLGPASATYEQFVKWQRELVDSPKAESALAFWKAHARDLPPLELPTDRVRPTLQTFRGGLRRFTIDPKAGAAVMDFARREGVTPYVVMLAAYAALLHRFSGQSRFAIGTPTSGRDHRAFEDIVGYFVNTIPLPTDLHGAPTFIELVHRMRTALVAGLEHAWIPFSRVVSHLGAGRDRSRSPIFQTMFAYEQAPRRKDAGLAGLALSVPGASIDFGDVTAETALVDSHVSVLDLTLVVVPVAGTPSVAWMQYNSDLFDAETIERMISSFQVLLAGAMDAPEARVSRLPILDEQQRRTIVEDWNTTDGPYDPDLHIHQLFEENARLFPDKVAVEFEQQTITYGALNERANVLARELRRLGCGRGSIVGICVERSIEMVAALVAIVKSGAGFLPIDESYPADRLTYMFEDSHMAVLVTHSELLPRLPAVPSAIGLVYVDTPRAGAAEESKNLELPIHRHDTFCILYTSGSTGRPKGTVLEHIGMVNHLRQHQQLFGLNHESRMLQYFSMSGDGASIGEIWPGLGGGATIVMTARREDSLMPGEPIVTALRKHRINYQLLPPVVGALTEPTDLPELEMVSFGGDMLSEDVVKRWAVPGRRVHNMWGPTEATMITVAGQCSADEDRRPLIGRPLLNTTAYVLDHELQPVPIGVVGELHIGGVALARGYLDRPRLTAEKFIPHPFRSNERLYKTGDMSRWLPDGRLDCLGRLDTMVKVHSQRIDLAEIESVLRLDPAVVDAVVVVREDTPGDKRVVAYVIASSEVSDLRALAREKLPAYMVPAAVVTLDRFPLTPYGKIDRKAMPAPDGAFAAAEYIAPRNATESALADIWQKVLKLERVGILDNFYDLGGNSLLATQVVSRVHQELGVEIAIRELFDATIVALAQSLAGRQSRSAVSIPRRAAGSAPPLSFSQSRLWFLDRLAPGSAGYNVPGALRLRGRLDAAVLERCFGEVLRRHDTLRTTFEEHDGEPIQRVHERVELTLPLEDLSALAPAEGEARVRELVRLEAGQPFDLARGPLVRGRLVKLAEEHVLLFTTHHIVSDGWSMGVLAREITALYGAYVAGQDSPLEELPIQYTDYAAWQREWLAGDELARQLGYWKAELEGVPVVLDLPTDRPRQPMQTFRGAKLERRLGAEVKRAVRTVSRTYGATEFMTLLSSFGVLMNRYSGQTKLIIGTPIANRTHQETEGLIGFFVNTLALGLRMEADSSFEVLLKDVKERTLAAYAHQDLPFERLVDALKIERDLSRSPVFQVMFALQNTPDVKLELPGLEVTQLPDTSDVAKFDLTLAVDDAGEGYTLLWEYNTDLFDRETIERMAANFEVLVVGMVATPRERISRLPRMTQAEEERLRVDWNHTQSGDTTDSRGLHELIEAHAARQPDAPALVHATGTVSYRELEDRANRLAGHLRERGVSHETIVALHLPRGVNAVIAALATLKCGAAYLPMDPCYPNERSRQIVEDSGARFVIVDDAVGAPQLGAPLVGMNDIDASNGLTARVPGQVHAATLAYVIYTSGSTGRPKGVAVEHGTLCSLVRWTHRTYGLTAADACSWIAGVAFDASVWEVWSCLSAGAALHIPPDAIRVDPAATAQWIARSRLTMAFVPTPVADAIFQEGHALDGLRWLHVGGQQLGVRPPQSAGFEVGNQYGPAETTVICTSSVVHSDGTIHIGRPIDGVEVYVVDESLQLVPQGALGELCVGGLGLARGYLGRSGLTAERFLPDPFSKRAGARMYRTGDVVRWRSSGELEFIGRTDHQVKIRGFRIELGEVENALRQAGARAVAVLSREDTPGDKRLAAYVVSDVSAAELRARIKERLPEYMVPSAFVVLDALPLTPNGKLDTKALPVPERGPSDGHVPPQTAAETYVAGLFGEVLGVEGVGMEDDFFELGGHSLLATRLVSRLSADLGVTLELRRVFEQSTPAGLLLALDDAFGGREQTEMVAQTLASVDELSDEEAEALLRGMRDA